MTDTHDSAPAYERVDDFVKDVPPPETETRDTASLSVEILEKSQQNLAELTTWHQVNPVNICWKNVSVEVNDPQKKGNKKTILCESYGTAPAGKILAIIGPSGSGKTTLLKVLCGQMVPTTGSIYYEGLEKKNELLEEDVMGFQGNACIVAQEDTLMGALTVRETIFYAASLKITDPNLDITTRVNQIITYLGLTQCADTKIGTVFFKGVSGGEKRRTSIAVELVTQPAILFLDEITSGLDATSAYAVLQIAHRLTTLGHTVIATLHQPGSRIISMLKEWDDYLMILEGGKQMYTGPIRNAVAFFNDIGFPVPKYTNPADYFLDVVNSDFQRSHDNANKVYQHFQSKCLPIIQKDVEKLLEQSKPEHRVVKKPVPQIFQIYHLLKRNFINHMRNPAVFLIRIIMYAGLCFCLGTLYWKIGDDAQAAQDRVSILFFVAAFLTFMSISGMPAFVEERHVYVREHTNNYYSTLAYSVANFLSSLPWIFLIALISTIFIYSMIQSRLGGDIFGIYLANLFVALIVAESMMVAISAVSPVFMIGLAAGAGLLGLYMIVCGFFLYPQNIPDGWIWVHYGLSFHTYSFETFMLNEFRGFKKGAVDGEQILSNYQMENGSIGLNFLWLLLMILGYRILFYVFLRFFNKTTK